MGKGFVKFSFLTLLTLGSVCVADPSAADILLQALPDTKAESTHAGTFQGVTLKDPLSMYFYAQWAKHQGLPYEVNLWASHVLKGNVEHAAHLWSKVQREIPQSLRVAAEAAQLYCLWKLNLGYTFVDRYLAQIHEKSFEQSDAHQALAHTIAPTLDSFLMQYPVVLDDEQRRFIQSLPSKGNIPYVLLKAWASLRQGTTGLALLDLLTEDQKVKLPLAKSVVYHLAKGNNLTQAASVLKNHMEPIVRKEGRPEGLSDYYLQIARLLYQVGSLDAAEAFYEKIPNGAPQFFDAQKELLWVWLRKGDRQKLRGGVKSFSLGLFEDRFVPGAYIVRAISNLKLCYYSEVQRDIDAFVEDHKKWVKSIEEATASDNPALTGPEDSYVQMANQAVSGVSSELERLEALHTRSLAAALPAVGKQLYWEQAQKNLRQTLETAQKLQRDERRRVWANRKSQLNEAILKMDFVKLEYLSQIRSYASKVVQPAKRDLALQDVSDSQIVFPHDGVVWPDEVFKLQALAQTHCLGGVLE